MRWEKCGHVIGLMDFKDLARSQLKYNKIKLKNLEILSEKRLKLLEIMSESTVKKE